jgi:hypothetical protein
MQRVLSRRRLDLPLLVVHRQQVRPKVVDHVDSTRRKTEQEAPKQSKLGVTNERVDSFFLGSGWRAGVAFSSRLLNVVEANRVSILWLAR